MTASAAHAFLGREFDGKGDLSDFVQFVSARHLKEIQSASLLRQVHGDLIVEPAVHSESLTQEPSEADGWLLTPSFFEDLSSPQVFCVLTADCFPVVLKTTQGPAAAALLHCGWRGTVLGILPKCLRRLSELGIAASHLEMFIGPGAQGCCYEVSPQFSEEVTRVNPRAKVRTEQREGRLFCHIGDLLREQASSSGLNPNQVHSSGDCTICDPQFFSYRREKQQAGRQLSYLFLSPGA